MKKIAYLALAMASFAPTLTPAQTFRGGRQNHETQRRTHERATESREARDQRVRGQTQSREASLKAEQTNQMVSLISGLTRGQSDSTQIKAGLRQEYVIQLVGANSNSTRVVTVRMNDLVERISKEHQKIKDVNESNLTGEVYNVHSNRKSLIEMTSKLVAIAAKKYAGSDANLVMARDAFARYVETTAKVMDSNSGASSREIYENLRVARALVLAKEKNDKLTDAEIMMIAAEKVQDSIAIEAYQITGIQGTNESAANKKQRLMDYLKDLKECI